MREQVSTPLPEPWFAAFVDLDWTDEKHCWVLRETGSDRSEYWVRTTSRRLSPNVTLASLQLAFGPAIRKAVDGHPCRSGYSNINVFAFQNSARLERVNLASFRPGE